MKVFLTKLYSPRVRELIEPRSEEERGGVGLKYRLTGAAYMKESKEFIYLASI
jgi:hypothetical protein